MFYTVRDFARQIGRSHNTVQGWVYRGQIPAPTHLLGKEGKRLYYSSEEFADILESFPQTMQGLHSKGAK